MIGAGMMLALVTTAQAEDEYRGTAAQRRACRPDVFRLCAAEIPNVRAITRCLARRVNSLSPGCRAVFEGRM
ncbi:MAG: hypothetical protein R3D62_14185 [Xanthobacteraceae bacterium]